MRVGLRRGGVLAVAAVLAASAVAGPLPSAHAVHLQPPERTYTYDVQGRGALQSDLEEFATHAAATVADVRGWSLGGSLAFTRVAGSSDLTLWLAEAAAVPTFSPACSAQWSCRVGRNVIINEARWRAAPASWTGSQTEYRHYVVNHELGHWLGLGHVTCAGPGQPAPVMQQQSKGLQGCAANVWPLAWERDAVARAHGTAVRPDLFSDIAGDVHAGAIRAVADAGIARGFADGTFRPSEPVLRGQMATFLVRARGLQRTGGSEFTDLADSVHAEAVRALADAGVARGYDDGTFKPLAVVTREQMASFLSRALALDTSDPSCAPADSRASQHAGAVCAVLRAGIAQGRADGSFAPGEVVARGQMASFLARMQGLLPR